LKIAQIIAILYSDILPLEFVKSTPQRNIKISFFIKNWKIINAPLVPGWLSGGSMLEVKLFGAGAVSYLSNKISFPLHQLPGQLFCFLVLNRGHPQNREHLAAVFWPDASVKDSKKALRNNLWRLKQSLIAADVPVSEYLLQDEDNLAFIKSSSYQLDVEDFEKLVNPYRDIHGIDLTSAQIKSLEMAVSLYSADLLQDLYEDWCLYDREHLRLLYINTINKLMVCYGMRQGYERAIEYGKRLISIDNTLEKVHRQLMWLYWMSGDHHAALTQYKLCYQTLHEEFRCTPMRETQHIYKLMLHNQVTPSDWNEILGTSDSFTSNPLPSNDPLCDRIQREMRRLQDMIEDTRKTSRIIEQLITEALDK
jgi:DNA-binding SARP family transcriptional activator